MPAYSGKYQYTGAAGEKIGEGPCQLSFDQENGFVAPAGATPLAFDLGDIDALKRGDWDLELTLYTGKKVTLRQFGPAFGRMADELTAAWRDRIVRCLLLEDLEEAGRFNGSAGLGDSRPQPAEIRIYKSNIAVLPVEGAPIQWRLADVDSISFDPAAYTITVLSEGRKLVFSKLAKKTDEFASTLQGAFDGLHTQSADVLHKTFPFLDPDRLQRLLTVMPEGRSVSLDAIGSVHPKMAAAFLARAVSPAHRPYFDALQKRAANGSVMAGFKFIRADDEEAEEPEPASEAPAANADSSAQEESPLFFWFFFPLDKLLAWEATTKSGRATYFFRANSDVASLTRGLALVNFRREPVYLPDDSLEQQPRFHRYAIGARKLPDLRALRAAFAGRAMHSTLEKWSAQVDAAKP